MHQDLGTEYVRFHGLLDDDMSVVINKRRSRAELEAQEAEALALWQRGELSPLKCLMYLGCCGA